MLPKQEIQGWEYAVKLILNLNILFNHNLFLRC